MEDASKFLQIAMTYYTKLLSIGVVTKSVHTNKKWNEMNNQSVHTN